MIRDPSDTKLIFEDIRNLYYEIISSRRFPMKFRIAFEQYVTKSQQLTETMRKEYHAKTGKKWIALNFPYWNVYTEIIKAIRRATYHGVPLQLHEVTLGIYPPIEVFSDKAPIQQKWLKRGFRAYKATCFLGLPFSTEHVGSGMGYPRKVKVNNDHQDPRNYIFPFKEFVSYELTWNVLENGVKASTDKAKSTDVVKITLKSYPALEKYWAYYSNELRENQYKSS